MGDYSKQRREQEESYVQRSLFESISNEVVEEDEKIVPEFPESIVSDFSLYLDRDRTAEVSQIIDKWLGSSQSGK